jgi:hypothetical protein
VTVVEAVVPSSAVAEIVNSPGPGKQHGIRSVALARPEGLVVDVIGAARKVTTVFGGKFSTVQVVSTLANLAGMVVTSHISVGEVGAGPALASADVTTRSPPHTMGTTTRCTANLRTSKRLSRHPNVSTIAVPLDLKPSSTGMVEWERCQESRKDDMGTAEPENVGASRETRAAEKRAARRIVAAWIANDVAWALILVWTIRRYRRRQDSQHRTPRQNDAREHGLACT